MTTPLCANRQFRAKFCGQQGVGGQVSILCTILSNPAFWTRSRARGMRDRVAIRERAGSREPLSCVLRTSGPDAKRGAAGDLGKQYSDIAYLTPEIGYLLMAGWQTTLSSNLLLLIFGSTGSQPFRTRPFQAPFPMLICHNCASRRNFSCLTTFLCPNASPAPVTRRSIVKLAARLHHNTQINPLRTPAPFRHPAIARHFSRDAHRNRASWFAKFGRLSAPGKQEEVDRQMEEDAAKRAILEKALETKQPADLMLRCSQLLVCHKG